MKNVIAFAAAAAILSAGAADRIDVAKFDPRMAVQCASVDSNGVKWIDGRHLPIEGRAFSGPFVGAVPQRYVPPPLPLYQYIDIICGMRGQ